MDEPIEGNASALVPKGVTLAVIDGVTEAMTLHGLDPKDLDARGRWALGGQHKLAGVAVAYTLEVVSPFGRGLRGASRLSVVKDRPGYVRPASAGGRKAGDVRFDTDADGIVRVRIEPMAAGSDPNGFSPAERRVLEALHGEDRPLYPRQIGDRVVEQGWAPGLARETVSRALTELARRSLVDSADGAYWRLDGASE